MGLYQKSSEIFKRSSKLNYLSPQVIRSVYLIKLNPMHHFSEKRIFSRGSKIPALYDGHELVIHRGNKYKVRYSNKWITGFKFGEFTWNRKIALYKAKQKKKKKKKIRFEHILQIYWTKGLFFGGSLFYTNKTLYELFQITPGLGKKSKVTILDKLELENSINVNVTLVNEFNTFYKKEIVGFLNHYYSQVASVNNTVHELRRVRIIRLYLVKSYKGYCHALGKPVHGQRTWSNAWSSYKNNLTLRNFISESKNSLEKNKLPEKINYKFVKKKYAINKKKNKKVEIKKMLWV